MWQKLSRRESLENQFVYEAFRVQNVFHVGISIMEFPPSFIVNVKDVLETRILEILEKIRLHLRECKFKLLFKDLRGMILTSLNSHTQYLISFFNLSSEGNGKKIPQK